MRAMLITLLLVCAMVFVTGCPRGGHALLAGAAVGLVAADAIHHAGHYTHYRSHHYSPQVDVHYGYTYPSHSVVYYNDYPTTRVYYSSYPRVTYPSRPTRVTYRPPVRYTSPRVTYGGNLSTRWTR